MLRQCFSASGEEPREASDKPSLSTISCFFTVTQSHGYRAQKGPPAQPRPAMENETRAKETHFLLLSTAPHPPDRTNQGRQWDQRVWAGQWQLWVSKFCRKCYSLTMLLLIFISVFLHCVFNLLSSSRLCSSHCVWRQTEWPVHRIYQFPPQLQSKLLPRCTASPWRFSQSTALQSGGQSQVSVCNSSCYGDSCANMARFMFPCREIISDEWK